MDRLFEGTAVSSLRHVSSLGWSVTKDEFGSTHDLQLAQPDYRAQSCWSYFYHLFDQDAATGLWLFCGQIKSFVTALQTHSRNIPVACAATTSRRPAPGETALHRPCLAAAGTWAALFPFRLRAWWERKPKELQSPEQAEQKRWVNRHRNKEKILKNREVRRENSPGYCLRSLQYL